MIILFCKNVKSNIINCLKKYDNINNLPYLECPKCNSTELIKYGTYNRQICYINEKNIILDTIKIQRVKCKTCGKTHALLPSFIVPYKISLLDVILSSILNEVVSINISYDTITKWNKEFNKFLPYLKTMFNIMDKIKIIHMIKDNINKIYERFYINYKKILMMIKYGTYNIAHF